MAKMPKEIVKFPNPMLRKKAKAVKRVTPQILDLIDSMELTMRQAPGVGLAAPQLGESVRVIIADAGEGLHAIINPKILSKSNKQTFLEGCLSLPGVEAPVERAETITVTGLNRCGQKIKIEAQGFLATILQHEIDHLDGFVFIDRVKDPSLIRYVPLIQEKKEETI